MWIVCGEALMDVFGEEETPAGMALDARIGGSPLNTAIGLARMGQPVAFFGGVSTGFLGERLVRAMRHEGLDLRLLERSAAPTTLGLVGLDERGVPSYAFYGEGGADRHVPASALHRLAQLPRPWHGIQVGSYATVVEPVASTQRALVEAEHGRTLIAYDPNVRLNVEPDLAKWRDMLAWMLPRTTLLKISDEDLDLLLPGTSPPDFAAQALSLDVALVVVTRGAEGATAWTAAAGEVVQAPVPVDVVDTVGAGDTFQAALLTWLQERGAMTTQALSALDRDALSQALGFAARAAAITCSRRGADLPRRVELG
jgi:fructokinase